MAERAALPDTLVIDGVDLWLGGTHALCDVSASSGPGQVLGVMGPNGAGKSSLLNVLNGFYRPRSGSVRFEGRELLGMAPHRIARLGLARTFQSVELSLEHTVLDNILLGRHVHNRASVLSAALFFGRGRGHEARQREHAERVLEFLQIERFRKRAVGSLSYGQQKLVEIGRALATEPKVLLLDEPTAGMNREEKEDVARVIHRARSELGICQVLIEHDVRFMADLSDQLLVLDFGMPIASGAPADVLELPVVLEAYVGTPVQRVPGAGAP